MGPQVDSDTLLASSELWQAIAGCMVSPCLSLGVIFRSVIFRLLASTSLVLVQRRLLDSITHALVTTGPSASPTICDVTLCLLAQNLLLNLELVEPLIKLCATAACSLQTSDGSCDTKGAQYVLYYAANACLPLLRQCPIQLPRCVFCLFFLGFEF